MSNRLTNFRSGTDTVVDVFYVLPWDGKSYQQQDESNATTHYVALEKNKVVAVCL
jgi:hypothetical protein